MCRSPCGNGWPRVFSIGRLVCVRTSAAADGTRKYLFGLADGRLIESVLIPAPGRQTLCISSQFGCAMGCAFCATARMRPVRNLTAGEIVGQVWEVQRELDADQQLTNVVFMGMGEPLANYDQVVKAIEVLTAEWGLNFSLPAGSRSPRSGWCRRCSVCCTRPGSI